MAKQVYMAYNQQGELCGISDDKDTLVKSLSSDVKSRKHYEITFDSEEEAREEEYLLNDGWSPFIDTEVDGKTLYFADSILPDSIPPINGGGHADIVAGDWWDGKARLVHP